jgi:ribonuclease Z
MKLKFLGTTASIPDVGEDCPCFLVNDRYLFDCGYDVLSALHETECDVSKIDHIIFTHMHHDHYLGLATLLFYYIHSPNYIETQTRRIGDLTILGPKEDVERVVNLAFSYLQLDLFYSAEDRPRIVPLDKNDVYETDDAVIKCAPSDHPVDARCFAFTEKGGSTLAISGDTLYREESVKLFSGADALIHEATLGYREGKGSNGHSTILEAIRIAELSDIDTLFPMHMSVKTAEYSVEKAAPSTSVKLIAPKRGKEYLI